MANTDKIKYALDGCKRGIEAAKQNIETFEAAIEKEYETIRTLRQMQKDIVRKDAERAAVKANDDSTD